MSIQAIAWVFEKSESRLAARHVLLSIANHADNQGCNSWPSVPVIARESRLSEREVQRCFDELVELGELMIEHGAGFKGSHLFTLPLMPGVTTCHPQNGSRGDKYSTGGVTSGRKGVTSGPRNKEEPSLTLEANLILSPPSAEGKEIRFQEFKEIIFKFYRWKCNRDPMWDGSDAKQLSLLLKSDPSLDVDTFRRWLKNYGDSTNISPGERPRFFLPKLSKYSISPLNSFGRSVDVEDEKRVSAGERTDAALAKVFGRMPEQGVTAPGPRGNGSRGGGLERVSRLLLERGN